MTQMTCIDLSVLN